MFSGTSKKSALKSLLLLWTSFGLVVWVYLMLLGFTTFEYNFSPPVFAHWELLENQYLYAWIHLFVFLPVFLLSFDKKVYYASRWKFLFPAIAFVAVPFLIWDHFFTSGGVWEFNEIYLSGFRIFSLPWEEIMFFITVPFACVFIYDCMNAYFPSNPLVKHERTITLSLLIILLIFGLIHYREMYTLTACLIAILSILWVKGRGEIAFLAWFYRAFLVVLIPFLLTDGILTGGYTDEPIVLYNHDHFSGLRLVSIPVEDFIYGFALLLQVNYLYVLFQRKSR